MTRTLLLVALAGAPFLAFALDPRSASAPVTPAATSSPCPNTIDREPVLVYDQTGSTLSGVLTRHVCIYDDGTVIAAQASGGTTLFPYESSARIAHVDPARITKLRTDITQAGVWSLCDEPLGIADFPLTTVTVMRGGTDAIGHTYSYYIPQSTTNQIVNMFIRNFVDEVLG